MPHDARLLQVRGGWGGREEGKGGWQVAGGWGVVVVVVGTWSLLVLLLFGLAVVGGSGGQRAAGVAAPHLVWGWGLLLQLPLLLLEEGGVGCVTWYGGSPCLFADWLAC